MNFYSVLTDIGKQKISEAQNSGVALSLTHMAVGDGNGSYYEPSKTQTELVNETWRGAINDLGSAENNQWIEVETVIPITDGGFTVREAGVFDDSGSLIAVGKYPQTYKPDLSSGVSNDLYIKMIIEIENASSVALLVDPAIVLAPREYVDERDLLIAPVGVPMPWPRDIAPEGWVIMKGQAFDTSLYPKLAIAYPTGILPDMRGMSLKGKPDERDILSYEADLVKEHTHTGTISDTDLGIVSTSENGSHQHWSGCYLRYFSAAPYGENTFSSNGWEHHKYQTVVHPLTSSAPDHSHDLTLGIHNHDVIIDNFGSIENTVKNIAVNWIVRLS